MTQQTNLIDLFESEETREYYPCVRFVNYLVRKESQWIKQAPEPTDYLFYTSLLVEFLVDEMRCDDDIHERFQEFMERNIHPPIKDFLQTK